MKKQLKQVLRVINPYRKLIISILLVGFFISTIYAFKTEEIKAQDNSKRNPRTSSVSWERTEEKTDSQKKDQTNTESEKTESSKNRQSNKQEQKKETRTTTKTVVAKKVNRDPAVKNAKNSSNEAQQKAEKVQIIVKNGPGAGSYQIQFEKDKSAFELMEQAQDDYGLIFSYSSSQYGIFIESIGGLTNNYKENKYWMLYQNGNLSNKGVGSIYPEDGDQITWQYEFVSW